MWDGDGDARKDTSYQRDDDVARYRVAAVPVGTAWNGGVVIAWYTPCTRNSQVACEKSRDKLIERANVAHCSGGFAEAVQLRRRYAVMKEAARAADESATRGVSPPGAPPTSPSTVTIKLGLTMAP